MLKDHCCFLTTAKEAKNMLDRPREVAPEPRMEDKMLDLLEDKRRALADTPYIDPNADIFNPTVLPDRMMRAFAPVFTIRHPIKQIESWYRASRLFGVNLDDSEFELCASYRFTRRLFNYYTELFSSGSGSPETPTGKPRWPVVIDGDDLINDTEGIATKFCELTGIDPKGVIYKWEAEEITKGPTEATFLGTLRKSDGVKKNKVRSISSFYAPYHAGIRRNSSFPI